MAKRLEKGILILSWVCVCFPFLVSKTVFEKTNSAKTQYKLIQSGFDVKCCTFFLFTVMVNGASLQNKHHINAFKYSNKQKNNKNNVS